MQYETLYIDTTEKLLAFNTCVAGNTMSFRVTAQHQELFNRLEQSNRKHSFTLNSSRAKTFNGFINEIIKEGEFLSVEVLRGQLN
ncbi:MAG TPA: hypothetical protein V6C81_21380 [Planktothrix sp.]|jgi:hypothetical protein